MSHGTGEEVGEIFATKVRGVVKWFNVRGGYCFINRNDTKEDVFVPPIAIDNNPKKTVRSVGDGEVVEFDVGFGEKGGEAEDWGGGWGGSF